MSLSYNYIIQRTFFNNGNTTFKTVKTGLNLMQAQAWCQDPESSSETATNATATARTKLRGDWYDTYRQGA